MNIQMWQQMQDRIKEMQRQIDELRELLHPVEVPQVLQSTLHLPKKSDERRA